MSTMCFDTPEEKRSQATSVTEGTTSLKDRNSIEWCGNRVR